MATKYSKLPQEDIEAGDPLDFNSIFTYDYPKYFSYGEHSKKFRSAFTFSGGLDQKFKKQVLVDAKPSMLTTICAGIITILCYVLFILTFPVSYWFCVKKLPHYERIVMFRLGKLLATKGPGRVLVFPCIDKCKYVDLRLKAFSVPPQTVMTMDAAHIQLGAEIYHHIKDSVVCVNNVQDLNTAMRNIAPSIMQKLLCKLELSEIEATKVTIAELMLNDLNKMTLTWGVEVTKVDFSPIKVLVEPDPDASLKPSPSSLIGKLFSGSGNTTMTKFPGGFPRGIPGGFPSQPAASEQTLVSILDEARPAAGRRLRSAEDLLRAVQPHLSTELVREFHCVYKFIITGKELKIFILDLKHGSGSAAMVSDASCEVDVTLTLSEGDLGRLLREEVSPLSAYMSGSLQVEGDTGLASRLSEVIAKVAK